MTSEINSSEIQYSCSEDADGRIFSRSTNTSADINKDDGKKVDTNEDSINHHGDEEQSLFHDRPIVCILEKTTAIERCRMFRVIRSKGKSLASGGFGVTITTSSNGEENDIEKEEGEASTHQQFPRHNLDAKVSTCINKAPQRGGDDNDNKEETSTFHKIKRNADDDDDNNSNQIRGETTTISAEYLFVEEALFLHERGLLRVLMSTSMTGEEICDIESKIITDDIVTPLDTSQLYQLLPTMGMSLAVYRVYSHLRSQDFRVLRHESNRYELLRRQHHQQEERRNRQEEQKHQQEAQTQGKQQQLEEDEICNDRQISDSLPHKFNRKQSIRLRRQVRESIQNATPPSIPFPSVNSTNDDGDNYDVNSSQKGDDKIRLCWDAYNPNSNFGKTHPGFPDFYVAVCFYNVPTVRFSDLKALIKEQCNGIPLKVATVSDSGTVVMFGITEIGIPPLVKAA